MKKQKNKNPLNRRILRELLGDWKKYIVVSLFLILTIGFVSGMYIANGSMMSAAEQGSTKYKLEHGHFELEKKADAEFLKEISAGQKADVKSYYLKKAKDELDEKFEKEFSGEYQSAYDLVYKEAYPSAYNEAYEQAYDEAWKKITDEIEEKYKDAEEKYELNDSAFQPVPVTVYENFFRNEDEDNNHDGIVDGTVRVYEKTEHINLASILEGRFPKNENEIAIDRMHADNVGVKVGDRIIVGGKEWTVAGVLAYVNYSTLYEKSSDFMFDALKFNVAMVTEGGFKRLEGPIHYAYAWKYVNVPDNENEEKSLSDDFMKALLTQTVVSENEIKEYLPAYANQAIHFATDDMGSDEAMGGVLLDILIVIIAFIFAITISNTITKESKSIGTLRASGYTRGELILHYLATPVIVTLFAAAVGNLLGYTVFKNVVVSMYYNSYSLPAYETIWNPSALFKTTIIPLLLMFVVNLVVIVRQMRHTPLAFLRQDLKKNKRKRAIRLPEWGFFRRFRFRIIFQNLQNYLILFFGIFFVSMMLAMAIGMPDTLDYYKEHTKDMMFVDYQYVLKAYEDEDSKPIMTTTDHSEIFGLKSLQKKSGEIDEEISVYGIAEESGYVKIDGLDDLGEDEVYISNSFAEKYAISKGDALVLEEKYENTKYEFKVAGFYDKSLNISVFMPLAQFRTVFGLEKDEFTGFLSNQEITDLSEDDIATVITERDITKMCDQLDHSMGAYMQYFQVLCVLLSAVLIYLLTKIIIEKNENAISMIKILGYENGEIAKLYLLSTTIVLLISDAVSVFLGSLVMGEAWKAIMSEYSGWYTFTMNPWGYAKMFLFILIGYLIVLGFDFRRIQKIPLDKALKNAE